VAKYTLGCKVQGRLSIFVLGRLVEHRGMSVSQPWQRLHTSLRKLDELLVQGKAGPLAHHCLASYLGLRPSHLHQRSHHRPVALGRRCNANTASPRPASRVRVGGHVHCMLARLHYMGAAHGGYLHAGQSRCWNFCSQRTGTPHNL
jgi:hypothetical protein